MIFLLIAIVCSTLIFTLFRLLPKFNAVTFPVIVINYFIALSCGLLMLESNYHLSDQLDKAWFRGGLLMGFLFIGLFYLMAYTSQRLGMGVSSVATKMSLVISVAYFMITDPSDEVTILKVIAIAIAVLGVLFSSSKDKSSSKAPFYLFLFPLIIFIGSAGIDIIIGHYSPNLSSDSDRYLFTATPFMTSAVVGTLVLVIQKIKGSLKINAPTVWSGLLLGLINFGSIFFLVKAFESGFIERSAIVSINNLGIILLSALTGVFFFSEKLKGKRLLGFGLSIVAIVMLFFA